MGRFMTTTASCLLWAGCWLTTWTVSEAALVMAAIVLRPWHLRLPVLLLIAGTLNLIVSPFYVGPISKFCFMIGGIDPPAWLLRRTIDLTDIGYLGSLLTSGSYGLLCWCGLRWAYEQYRHQSKVALTVRSDVAARALGSGALDALATTSDRLQSLLRKNGISEQGAIEVIQAEDHYVRLHLAQGSRLVFYRFADILSEMRGVDGLQVHRSFWVRRAGIADVLQDSGSLRLQMNNGLIVPVSQKHRALLGYLLENREPART